MKFQKINKLIIDFCVMCYNKTQTNFFFLCKLTYYEFFFSNIDLDVDSQVDGGNAVMSCAESESDSDVADVIDSEEECLETPYVLAREDEFGAVSKKKKNWHIFVYALVFKNSQIRLVNRSKNWERKTKV
jgi:hypothetical protein